MVLCLQIPEVVHIICDELDEDSALSLGIAHKGFLEPALDKRWRHLTSFMPLVACLPDDLLETDEWVPSGPYELTLSQLCHPWSQILRRPLILSDARRYLDYYAPRIRSFRPTYKEGSAILSLEVLQSLQAVTNWRPGAMMPLLTNLTWLSPISNALEDTKMSHYHLCISLFAGPHLTSIEFPAGEEDHLYSGMIYSLTQALPHLKRLSICIEAATNDHNAMPFAHGYIKSLASTNLEQVHVYGEEASAYLTSDTIYHLAILPCLTILKLKNFMDLRPLYSPVFGQPPFDYDPLTGFTMLTHLTLQAVGLSDIVGFLQHLPPLNVIAQLECRADLMRDVRDIQNVIQAIQLHGNPLALNHLHLNAYYDPFEQADDDDRSMTKPEIDIRPLLEFKRLEYLDIRINRLHVAVTPQLIEVFGIHWPTIRHLNLTISGVTCAYPIDGPPPSIDHASLVWLLNACPKLTHLGLRFDARKIGMDPEQDDNIITCARLHNLDTPAYVVLPTDEDLEAGARLHDLNTPDYASSPVSSEDTDEDEDEDLAQPFPNLKTLNVGGSPIHSSKEVAFFLEQIVPPSCELEYFAVAWGSTCDDGEIERWSSRRTKRWAKVAACLASWAATGEIEYVSDDD